MRTIEEVIEILKDKSRVDPIGMGGETVVIEKKVLEEAAIYLEDFLVCGGIA